MRIWVNKIFSYQQSWVCALLIICTEAIADPSYPQMIALDQLSLQQAEQLFSSNNRDLLAARRAIESANADTLIAGQKPNPVLSLGFSNLNLNRGVGNHNQNGKQDFWDQTYNSSLQVTQLYERGDKRALRSAVAQSAVKATQLDYSETYRQQGLAMANAYYDLKLAQESLLIQQANVNNYEKTLKAAQLRLKAGDTASSDVARIQVDALRANNDMRQAEATLQKAQTMLAYLLGKDQDASKLYVSDPWPVLATETSASISALKDSRWLPQRPDVQAAEARMEQAENSKKLAESLKTRDFTWSLAYQHFPGQEPGTSPDTVGASLSIPLFTNYQYEGEVARADVGYTSAMQAKDQIKAAAIAEMRLAKADLDAAIDKNQRFDISILSEAQKAADAAEFAYKHGAMDVMDLLDARRILRTLQLEAVSVKADYAKSLAGWLAATRQAFVYRD